MGVIQYHLNSLEKEKKIVHQRTGIRKRFYPSYVFGDRQQEILAVLSQEIERDLILYMIDNPNATQKQLAEMTGVSPATINWHTKRLVDSGLVSAVREGQFVKYVFRGNTRELLNLVQNYHASVWTRWADRLSEVVSQFGEEEGPDDQQREGQYPIRDDKDGERFEW